MKSRPIRIFVVLALISILGIVITQVYWFNKAYQNNEEEFNKNANIAFREVVKGILKFNSNTTVPVDPVKRLTPNYFAVMVNDKINAGLLEYYLQTELKRFNIRQGFEYSIYDCANEKIVYGGYVEGEGNYSPKEKINLPKWNGDNYYFTVYFPHKASGIVKQMSLWLYSSAIIIIVVIFFSYSLFVILKQKRLSEIQRDFINNMAHETRTPLATITISAQTLKDPSIVQNPQRLLNYATIIMDEAVKLKNQIERVLSVADSESVMQLNKENFDVHLLIENVVHQLVQSTNKKVNLKFDPMATHSVIHADKLHISNLIVNLVDNSIKYSGEEVSIHIKTSNKNTKYIDLQFSDDGQGISKDYQKRIFDKFYRVPTGNIHNAKGFGIGLNFVALIARAHKGHIKVISEINRGSDFIVTLPTI